MPTRFTFARHERSGDPHFDLFLEPQEGARLMTWNLPSMPKAGTSVVGRRIADHRAIYLDFEGEISDGRGHVTLIDTGTCEWLERGEDRIRVKLSGRLPAGEFELVRRAGDEWDVRSV